MRNARKKFYSKNKYKFIALFTFVFCVTCLKVCAEEMSTDKARLYREKLIEEAKKHIGAPYTFGAIGPDTFDCSGLIYYSARTANGTQLPRTAKAIYAYVRVVPDSEKEPGDLLFFKTTSSGSVSHVGIYLGNNQFISAISDGPNAGVSISVLNDYWKPRCIGVGQIYKSGKSEKDNYDYLEEDFVPPENPTDISKKNSNGTDNKKEKKTVKKSENNINLYENQNDSILLMTSIMGGWSFLKDESVKMNFRTVDIQAGLKFTVPKYKPSISTFFRYNADLHVFQIPLIFALSFNKFMDFYTGPLFTLGTAISANYGKLTPLIFPGVIGFSIASPEIPVARTKLQFVQNIEFSFYADKNFKPLSFLKTLSTGLYFFTGIKFSFPPSSLRA